MKRTVPLALTASAGLLATCALLPAHLAAQEDAYWIANRGSNDVMQVHQCGALLQTVGLGSPLRSAHVAPDGKVWVVRFIQTTFDILDSNGNLIASPTASLGSPYQIAFDARGHAWVSGGTGVEEFDANGNTVASYTLPAAAPLGITVDSQGNKWIAHRVGPPGSLSRIDGTTGAVTSHQLPAGSQILPTQVYADFRGLGAGGTPMPSHIWVIGDNRGAGEIVEFDSAGNALNTYVMNATGAFGTIVGDVDPTTQRVRTIFVGDFRNGEVWAIDAATGAGTAFPVAVNVNALNIGGFGNLWVTERNFGGPSKLFRVDPLALTIETSTGIGSTTQDSPSTRWQFATTVDPIGDLDNDGVPNVFEVFNRSSPFSNSSRPDGSTSVEGPASIGAMTSVSIAAPGGVSTTVFFSTGRAAAPFTIPGIGGAFEPDLTMLFPFGVSGIGPFSISTMIPADPGLIGISLWMQAIQLNAAPRFTNATCIPFF